MCEYKPEIINHITQLSPEEDIETNKIIGFHGTNCRALEYYLEHGFWHGTNTPDGKKLCIASTTAPFEKEEDESVFIKAENSFDYAKEISTKYALDSTIVMNLGGLTTTNQYLSDIIYDLADDTFNLDIGKTIEPSELDDITSEIAKLSGLTQQRVKQLYDDSIEEAGYLIGFSENLLETKEIEEGDCEYEITVPVEQLTHPHINLIKPLSKKTEDHLHSILTK